MAQASIVTVDALKILKRARVYTKMKRGYCNRWQKKETVDESGQAIMKSGESSEEDAFSEKCKRGCSLTILGTHQGRAPSILTLSGLSLPCVQG